MPTRRPALACLFAAFLLPPAWAQPMPMHHCDASATPPGSAFPAKPDARFPGPAGHLPPFLLGLDLSEAQQDQVFKILHAQAPEMRQHAKALHKAREELRRLVLSDQYDEGRARALADAAATAESSLSLLRARTDRELLALLTPEQRKEAANRAGRAPRRGGE